MLGTPRIPNVTWNTPRPHTSILSVNGNLASLIQSGKNTPPRPRTGQVPGLPSLSTQAESVLPCSSLSALLYPPANPSNSLNFPGTHSPGVHISQTSTFQADCNKSPSVFQQSFNALPWGGGVFWPDKMREAGFPSSPLRHLVEPVHVTLFPPPGGRP